jgi:hypothetical protein
MGEPSSRQPEIPSSPQDGPWPYLGVGCVTTISGFFGGGMIAVLIAKIVGFARSCTPDSETGAPCNWYTFATVGAVFGMLVFPTVAVMLLRRSRTKH